MGVVVGIFVRESSRREEVEFRGAFEVVTNGACQF